MKRKKKYSRHTTVRTYINTKQKVNAISKALKMSPARFLEGLIDNLFEICGEHKEIVLKYEGRLDTLTLNIMVCPKATYQFPLNSLRILKEHKQSFPLEKLTLKK